MDSQTVEQLWRRSVRDVADLSTAALDRRYQSPATPPPEAELPSERFEPLGLIGRGGCGEVFRARQPALEREIALKQLRRNDATERASFLAEAVVTGRLEHPNIVPVYSLVREDGGELQLAMKLVEGRTWREVLAGPEVDLVAQLETLIQVCNAVAYAHSRRIAHLDLKPENVMIGHFGEVLVLDWGLAVDVSRCSNPASRVRHKSSLTGPCGTPSYIAPEQARGETAAIGLATDVYLLGAILYEILYGHPPHRGDTLLAVLERVAAGELPAFPEGAPAELLRICRDAMAAAPAARPSVAAFREELRQYLRHRESHAIAGQAARLLGACRQAAAAPELAGPARSQLYEDFAAAVAGFSQAQSLWRENPRARAGKRDARLAYAEAAVRFRDLGLAAAQLAQLDAAEPGAASVREGLRAAHAQAARELRSKRLLRRGLTASLIALFVLLSAGLAVLQVKNTALDRALRTVESQADEIGAQKTEVETQRDFARRRGEVAVEALTELTRSVSTELVDELGGERAHTVARNLLTVALEGFQQLRATELEAGALSRGDGQVALNLAQLSLEVSGDAAQAAAEAARAERLLAASLDEGREVVHDYNFSLRLLAQAHERLPGDDEALRWGERALAFAREQHARRPDGVPEALDLANSLLALAEQMATWRGSERYAALCEEGVTLLEALHAQHPEHSLLAVHRASGLRLLAGVRREAGAVDQAEEIAQQALRIAREAFAADPGRLLLRRCLAVCGVRLAWLRFERAFPDDARTLSTEAREHLAFLRELMPSSATLAREWVDLLHLQAELAAYDEEHERALAMIDEALSLAHHLHAAFPDDLEARRRTALVLALAARVRGARSELPAALAAQQQARALLAGATAAQPLARLYRHDLAVATWELGKLHAQAGQSDSARVALLDSRARFVDLLTGDPRSLPLAINLAQTLDSLARVEADSGRPEQARSVSLEAVEVWRGLVTLAPDDPATVGRAVEGLELSANVQFDIGRPTAAVELLREARTLLEAGLASAPESIDLLHTAGWIGDRLAMLEGQGGDLTRAEASSRRALVAWERLVGVDPEDGRALYHLALGHKTLAYIVQAQGRIEEARQSFTTGLELLDALLARGGATVEWRGARAIFLFNLGLLARDRGELDRALELVEAAIENHATLPDSVPGVAVARAAFAEEREALLRRKANPDAPSRAELEARATGLHQQGRCAEAVPVYEELLATGADDRLYYFAALCASQARAQAEGEAAARYEALALDWLAGWLRELDRLREELEAAREQRPDDPQPKEALATIAAMIENVAETHPDFAELRATEGFRVLFGGR